VTDEAPRRRRPGPRAIAAIGIALAAVGVFCTWTTAGPVSLNGTQGPNDGWLVLIALAVALCCLRSLARGWWFAVTAVAACALVVAWVAIEDWRENGAVLDADVGYGLLLVLAGSVILAASAVMRGLQLARGTAPTSGAKSVGRIALAVAGLAAFALFVGIFRQVIWLTEEDHWPPPPNAVTSATAEAATEAFARQDDVDAHDAAFDFAPSTAATIEPWVEGKVFFPKIFADIENAKSSVHILMFGWREGDIGQQMAALLKRKLAEGVEVRAIVDRFGSRPYEQAREMYTGLAAARGHIVVNDELPLDKDDLFPDDQFTDWRHDELGRADHRKLYVIDGRIAWTGGAGIEDHFANGEFHDVMVRVTGDVVRQAQAAFLSSFHGYGGPLPDDLSRYFPEPEAGSTPITLAQVIPGGFTAAAQAVREQIDGAMGRLDLMNPYLTDRDIVERVLAAARRGVKVRIVVSETSNNPQASAALEHHYGDLIDAGVEIWELPGTVVHAKVVVADDVVSFGTLNMDAWALYRDAEIAMTARSPEAARLFEERLFEPDIARSTRGEPRTGTAERLESWIWDKLGYFL
jgi:cardiolipin synthase